MSGNHQLPQEIAKNAKGNTVFYHGGHGGIAGRQMVGKWRAGIFGTESRHGVVKRPSMVSQCGYRGISVGGATELRVRCRSADSHSCQRTWPTTPSGWSAVEIHAVQHCTGGLTPLRSPRWCCDACERDQETEDDRPQAYRNSTEGNAGFTTENLAWAWPATQKGRDERTS